MVNADKSGSNPLSFQICLPHTFVWCSFSDPPIRRWIPHVGGQSIQRRERRHRCCRRRGVSCSCQRVPRRGCRRGEPFFLTPASSWSRSMTCSALAHDSYAASRPVPPPCYSRPHRLQRCHATCCCRPALHLQGEALLQCLCYDTGFLYSFCFQKK
jgi:hypothetical protein